MDFKKLKLLTELIDQYEWQMGHGLAVWIEYSNCTTVFDKILEIDTERFPNCLAERTGIYIDHFEDILSFYPTILRSCSLKTKIEICQRKNLKSEKHFSAGL